MNNRIDLIRNGIERTPRKILHIGACRGEAGLYSRHGIEGYHVEAIPQMFEVLKGHCAKASKQTPIQACLDEDIRTVEFNVATNFASSSFLRLGRHAVAYPEITYQDRLTLRTETVDGLIASGVIPGDIDFAVLDVQGAELRVLRGASVLLAAPTLLGLMVEVSADPLYEGGATYLDICRHLQSLGFYTRTVEFYEDGWGDAIFTRRYWKLTDDEIPPMFLEYAPEFAGRNVAPLGVCTQSSVHALQGVNGSDLAVHGRRGIGFLFHTEREACPWWQIDFAAPRRFDEVIVFNRLDEGRSRAHAIRIEVSEDLVEWRNIWTNEYTFGGVDGRPLRVECPGTSARAVRILGSPDEFLHLNRIEIYDRSTPAA